MSEVEHFLAGAEAMRELAAKAVEPERPRPCDCEPWSCTCGNYGDAQSVAAWDSDAAAARIIRALPLPAPPLP